ncbi:uncharacterized protein C10orf67 homolog, mitochondrial [Paroedura picta]|uniref:uncharacterized protein C10orf67 homolog, mitochondrial n=1 Tax=Paroedura picta TaxID=143630 RepID=UPI0040567029
MAAALLKEAEMSAAERARTMLATRRLSISPHILELLTLPSLDDLEADYRPRISEDLKIGYAISDCATQTEGSEITDLKEFTVTTKNLIEFTNSMYDDFMKYKTFLQTQYEDKIREHAFHLWEEINDRLEYIEKLYKEKEVKMRRSYQQQLCDALAILRINYAKYLPLSKGLPGEGEDSLAARFERMRESLEDKDLTIAGLEEEIAGYKARESKKLPYEEDNEFEKEFLQQENKEMREEIASLDGKVARLQEAMKRKEKEQVELDTEIKQLQGKRERDLKTIEKLLNSQEILKLEVEREKQRVLSKAREVREAQEMVARLTKHATTSEVEAAEKVQTIQLHKKEMRTVKELKEATEREKAAREAAEKEAAERKAATEREAVELGILFGSQQELLASLYKGDKDIAGKALLNEVARLKRSEREARNLINRLELEIYQINQAWELKFQILKKSLHAIKDEMFLRQSLRQSAKFRRPTLAERNAHPLFIQHPLRKKGPSSLYIHHPPLPQINSQEVVEMNEEGSSGTKTPVTVDMPSVLEGASESEEEMEMEEAKETPFPLSPQSSPQ